MTEANDQNQKEKTKTILVVDDEPSFLNFLCDCLRALGYAIVAVRDAKSGWKEYKKAKPDLAIIDMRMPVVSGLTLLNRIRKKDSSTPVIIITGYDLKETQNEAQKNGADEFIPKPFKLFDLQNSIEKLLGQSPLELEIHRLRKLTSILNEENKRLKSGIPLISKGQNGSFTGKDVDEDRNFYRSLVHSLRNEFEIIGSWVDLMRKKASTVPEIQRECDIIWRSLVYSQILLRRWLDYLDIGRPPYEPIDVVEVLSRTEQLVRPRIPSNIQLNIKIDLNMKEQIVSANFEQLMGVLLELIQNAVNVIREKGGTIELKLEKMKKEIIISVKNDGPQIPRELRENLFKKRMPSKSGLGLGLFLCNKVVRELGGKLDFRTSRKKGTTFTILLPIASEKRG